MNRRRAMALIVAVSMAGVVLTGCTSVTDPDEVGLYYSIGSIDGNTFDHCTKPGGTDDEPYNDEIYYLPMSARTWTIANNDKADSRDPIIASAKAEAGQPSGVEVKVWSQTKFVLNTFCGGDGKGGVVKEFWEKTGRRYHADTDDGFKDMLLDNLVAALQKVTRDAIRQYSADELIGNLDGATTKAQTQISNAFASELNRMAGGPFFCGPSFNRAKSDCPPVEFSILDVKYADDGIQAARNEKVKALEQAAAKLATAQGEANALVAEAEGKARAAKALEALYSSPGWVSLQKAITQQQGLIEACRAAKECRLIVGSNGQLIMS